MSTPIQPKLHEDESNRQCYEYDENANRESLDGGKDKDRKKDCADMCFICREKDLSDAECKVCQNIRLYHSKNKNGVDCIEAGANVAFPGPGVIKRNHIYGNYVVASRTIEEGELIILERPINIGPYGTPDILPLCLCCCKDVGLSSKCSKCKWPICGLECEQFYLHAENECEIFARNGVRCKDEFKEYFCVETLRILLLREKNSYAWKRILEFEPHSEARAKDCRAKEATDFIINFIRYKCNLADQYSPEIIDHVVGVLSINSFWAYKELGLFTSCMFDKITLLAHDCDPNTTRKLLLMPKESQEEKSIIPPAKICDIVLQVTASRRIEEGEMITIRYINVEQPFLKRREELKETFYFECTCSRCLCELLELEKAKAEAKLSEIVL